MVFLFSFQVSTCLSFSAGSVGGEYNHKFSINEIPSHCHNTVFYIQGNEGWTGTISGTTAVTRHGKYSSGTADDIPYGYTGYTTGETFRIGLVNGASTSNIGSDGYHNNIQPYIVTYMFKRTS